jgi:hypothetical protein
METVGASNSALDTEVAEVVWLPVLKALQKLQYPLEKTLVEALITQGEEIVP